MANSLLAHLYSRIRGSQEDIATLSLQYLLSQSKPLNEAFTRQISELLGVDLGERLQYVCQAVGENNERPDMVGYDNVGHESVLCEMKFYAGLTANQPLGYLDRIENGGGAGLIFICPQARQTSLWGKLLSICQSREIEKIGPKCVCVNGVRMAILTRAEVLENLYKIGLQAANNYVSDIQQLQGYCAQMDTDAFIPFVPEELSADTARKNQRYYDVVDEVTRRICADQDVVAAKITTKATDRYYEKRVDINGFKVSVIYDRDLWKSNSSVDTPFWMSVYDYDWGQAQHILARIPEEQMDNEVYNMTYFALEPLVHSTLDEVCEDLKTKLMAYLNLLSEGE